MTATSVDIRNYHFSVTYSEEDGYFCARVKEFPGVLSLAVSAQEAIGNVQSVLTEIVERRISSGLSLPEPEIEDREYSGRLNLRVTRTLHRNLAEAANRENVSLNQYCANLLQEQHVVKGFQLVIAATMSPAPIIPSFLALKATAELPTTVEQISLIPPFKGKVELYR